MFNRRKKKKAGKKPKITKRNYNEGRKSIVDIFVDGWIGTTKDLVISVVGSAVLMVAYYLLLAKPETTEDWLNIVLQVLIAEMGLTLLAFCFKRRRELNERRGDVNEQEKIRTK